MKKKAKVTLEFNGKTITEGHDGVLIITFDEVDDKLLVNTLGNVDNKVAYSALGNVIEEDTETKEVDELK